MEACLHSGNTGPLKFIKPTIVLVQHSTSPGWVPHYHLQTVPCLLPLLSASCWISPCHPLPTPHIYSGHGKGLGFLSAMFPPCRHLSTPTPKLVSLTPRLPFSNILFLASSNGPILDTMKTDCLVLSSSLSLVPWLPFSDLQVLTPVVLFQQTQA